MKPNRSSVAMSLAATLAGAACTSPVRSDETLVAQENYCRAETDRAFASGLSLSGGVNRWFHFRAVTPLGKQNVIRMNRDTLYSSALVDTSKGATLTVPAMSDGRYFSVLLIDNDHYAAGVIYAPGVHQLPQNTKYLGLILRIHLRDPDDPADIALVNGLQDKFIIEAASADPFPEPKWSRASLSERTATYNAEFAKYDKYPDDWMGPRGVANDKTRHLACAGAWGLFPNKDALYINYNGHLPADGCHTATYAVPENEGFWSLTVYGADGYMKSTNSVLNAFNTTFNKDGTFTARFGSEQACGAAPNRLDVTKGWNVLMRVYRPGESVLNGGYTLPAATRVR